MFVHAIQYKNISYILISKNGLFSESGKMENFTDKNWYMDTSG